MTFPDLLAEADRYARFTMKTCGCLAPIMMAATGQGTMLFSPDKNAAAHAMGRAAFARRCADASGLCTDALGASRNFRHHTTPAPKHPDGRRRTATTAAFQ